jgi:hypothetical protein
VTWEEIEKGICIEDFGIDDTRERIHSFGDLFKPLLLKRGRVALEKLV